MWSNWKSNASASSEIASCGEGRSSGDPATRRPPRPSGGGRRQFRAAHLTLTRSTPTTPIDSPDPDPHRPIFEDLDPESSITRRWVALARAHRAGQTCSPGELLLANLSVVRRALSSARRTSAAACGKIRRTPSCAITDRTPRTAGPNATGRSLRCGRRVRPAGPRQIATPAAICRGSTPARSSSARRRFHPRWKINTPHERKSPLPLARGLLD